jgi:hypothetical protein
LFGEKSTAGWRLISQANMMSNGERACVVVTMRPSTLVLLQNGIFILIIYIFSLFRFFAPIPTTSEWGPPCRFFTPLPLRMAVLPM